MESKAFFFRGSNGSNKQTSDSVFFKMTSRLDQSTPMCIYPSIYKKNQANRTFTSSLGFNQNLLLPKPFQIWNLHRLREDPRLLVDDVKSTFPGGRHHQQECCESYQEGVDPGSSSQLACSRKISLNASKGSPLGKQSTCVYPQKICSRWSFLYLFRL